LGCVVNCAETNPDTADFAGEHNDFRTLYFRDQRFFDNADE